LQPKRVTNDAMPPTPVLWCHLVNDFVSQLEIARKIHKKSLFWRSRLSKVIEFSANRKPVYHFLLVINDNLLFTNISSTTKKRKIDEN